MREFQDHQDGTWVASVGERPGDDYKGRYFFVMERKDEGGESIALEDVRWNRAGTAERALKTMSEVELRKRLRAAQGRSLLEV